MPSSEMFFPSLSTLKLKKNARVREVLILETHQNKIIIIRLQSTYLTDYVLILRKGVNIARHSHKKSYCISVSYKTIRNMNGLMFEQKYLKINLSQNEMKCLLVSSPPKTSSHNFTLHLLLLSLLLQLLLLLFEIAIQHRLSTVDDSVSLKHSDTGYSSNKDSKSSGRRFSNVIHKKVNYEF